MGRRIRRGWEGTGKQKEPVAGGQQSQEGTWERSVLQDKQNRPKVGHKLGQPVPRFLFQRPPLRSTWPFFPLYLRKPETDPSRQSTLSISV